MGKALTQDSLADLCSLRRLAIIQLEQGVHEARPSTIAALAKALNQTTDVVYNACRESYRRGAAARAHDATPIMGATTQGDGQAVAGVHGPHATEGGAA